MKPKNQNKSSDWLSEVFDRVERERGDYVKSRFYVVERTPSKCYRRGDGHGGSELDWTSEKVVIVSDYFGTKAKAQAFLDAHDPDEGNKLEIKQDKLYRKLVEKWY
jgi:hypothetical protein